MNFSNRSYASYSLGFPRAGRWLVRFNSDSSYYSPDFGNHAGDDARAENGAKDGMPFNGSTGIGPYSALILSQDD
jgi:1,4-alpha-glucan branching enzyme